MASSVGSTATPTSEEVGSLTTKAPVPVHVQALMGQNPNAQLKLHSPAKFPLPVPEIQAGGSKSETVGTDSGADMVAHAVSGQKP